MNHHQNNIALDSRTVLLGTSVRDILKRTAGAKRKGIDFKLYTVSGQEKSRSEDMQTVLTLLSTMQNPNPSYQLEQDSQHKLLAESLDKVLLSDRVRSCKDFYRTNNKKDLESSRTMMTVG